MDCQLKKRTFLRLPLVPITSDSAYYLLCVLFIIYFYNLSTNIPPPPPCTMEILRTAMCVDIFWSGTLYPRLLVTS